jgi:mono/diheme cytochrome c family protein
MLGARSMSRAFVVLAAGCVAMSAAETGSLQAARPQQATTASASSDTAASRRALLDRYCIACHNDKLKTQGLSLQGIDVANVPGGAEVWEKVIRKVRTGAMPPMGRPRPEKAASDAFAASLESDIDRAAAAHPNPGRTETLHRLNRTEYQNAIRDLLALKIDAAALVPADDQSYGFDNIAGVLKVSPTLIERYMGAAREISRIAVGASPLAPAGETFRVVSDLSQYDHRDGLPFGTRGGMSVSYNFPRDAEYDIKVALLDLFSGAPIQETHQLEVTVDGERVKVFTLAPSAPSATPEDADSYRASPDDMQVRIPLKAGPRVVTAAFIKKTNALAESVRDPFDRPHGEGDYLMYQPHIGTVTISGPFNASGVQDTPSRRRIFVCKPSKAADEASCARQIISTLAARAYRRPVTDTDVKSLLTFYNEGQASGGFEVGIERAVRALLVSPSFLFRVENDPAAAAPHSAYRLSDIELASRISFFLWSSIPDDELREAAAKGALKRPAELERQVRRMLADPRSEALAQNFAGQWLRLRNISGALPNDVIFPNFGEGLRQDFVRETELFFDSILRENRSVLDLLTANFTFLNERLAKHYGITDVYGSDFRRVTLADENRRGLLGQGSILTVTSYSDRTSPVGRGKWVLENVLGTPPPPPPPNVPPLREDPNPGKLLSMRERMEQHRANPVCASCHSRMDPLGLALENFDAVGRWRPRMPGGTAIDVSGAMPDGTKFDGPAELRNQLVRHPEQFATVVTEKLLTYALGRGVEYYDGPALRQITRGAAATNFSMASLIVGVIKSTPFQMRIVTPAADAPVAVAARP